MVGTQANSLGPIDVRDVVPLNTGHIALCSESRKGHKEVVRQSHQVPSPVNERRMILLIVTVDDRHHEWWFHIHSTMELEDGCQPLLHSIREGHVLWSFEVLVVEEASGQLSWLVEEEGENSLVVRRIGLRCGKLSATISNQQTD